MQYSSSNAALILYAALKYYSIRISFLFNYVQYGIDEVIDLGVF